MVKYARIIDLPSSLIDADYNGEIETYLNKIESLYYGESNSLEYGLKKYQNFETELILYSPELLSVCDEKLNVSYLKKFDVILVNSYKILEDFKNVLRLVKNECLILMWDGIGMYLNEYKHYCHSILTCSISIKREYDKLGITSYYIPFSYDNRLDELLDVEKRQLGSNELNTAFIGGLNVGVRAHLNRIDLLYNLREDVDLYLKDNGSILKKATYLAFNNPARAARYLKINRANLGVKTGLSYHETILNYTAVVNKHLDGINTPSNIRLFEVTGLGRVLITDRLQGLDELFVENEEVLAYSSLNELKNHIRDLSHNPDYAKTLAKNARLKTLSSFSIKNRTERFVDIMSELR